MTLLGNYFRKCYRIFLEISTFQEIQKNRKHAFNLIKYAKFKLKIKEVRRFHTTTCRHKKKQEKLFYLVYLLNYS